MNPIDPSSKDLSVQPGASWRLKRPTPRSVLEVALNAVVLAASLFLIFSMVHSRVAARRSVQSNLSVPPKGAKIVIPGVEWSNSRNTIVLALSAHCPFCTASADFYRRLGEVCKARQVPIIAVLPQPTDEGWSYIKGLRVRVDVVKQAPLASVRVSGTPTLMFINSDGEVTDSWAGQLSSKLEEEVISRL